MSVPPEALLAEREWLAGLARALAGNGTEADDLEQETWATVLRSPPGREGLLRGWLATILRRRAVDMRRAEARRVAREEAAARSEPVPSAADAVARAELQRRVLDAVLSLEDPGRTALILRYYEGLPPREIAARTGAPVETVRTRIRRALEMLRAKLDSRHHGRREEWLPALLAATGAGEGGRAGNATVEATSTGPRRAGRVPVLLLGSTAVVAAALVVWILASQAGFPPRMPGGPVRGNGIVLAEARPGDTPPAATGGVPVRSPGAPVAPIPAGAGSSAAAPAAAGLVEEKGVLVLRASVESEAPESGRPITLLATFANEGNGPLAFFVPESASWNPFPRWRFRGADGQVLEPAPGPSPQTRWRKGVVGEIVRLKPGECRSFETRVERVRGLEGDRTTVPVPPGSYVISCIYSQEGDRVLWSEDFGKPNERRSVADLWTGEIGSPELSFRLLAGDRPTVSLDAPGPLVPGTPGRIRITIRNAALRPLDLRGRLVLDSYRKGSGVVAEAAIAPGKGIAGPAGAEPDRLHVEAESALVVEVDLARLPGNWLVPGDLCLGAAFHPADGGEPLRSELAFTRVEAPPDATGLGLRLLVTPRRDGTLELALRNGGRETLRVPRTFDWPARLEIAVRRPSEAMEEGPITVTSHDGRSALTCPVIAWTLAGPARDLGSADFVDLSPGDSIVGFADLAGPQEWRFPSGAYEVRVTWTNIESGIRAGLDAGAVVVGRVESEPVRVDR